MRLCPPSPPFLLTPNRSSMLFLTWFAFVSRLSITLSYVCCLTVGPFKIAIAIVLRHTLQFQCAPSSRTIAHLRGGLFVDVYAIVRFCYMTFQHVILPYLSDGRGYDARNIQFFCVSLAFDRVPTKPHFHARSVARIGVIDCPTLSFCPANTAHDTTAFCMMCCSDFVRSDPFKIMSASNITQIPHVVRSIDRVSHCRQPVGPVFPCSASDTHSFACRFPPRQARRKREP